jgi:RND family efflux transporter MFP subunit
MRLTLLPAAIAALCLLVGCKGKEPEVKVEAPRPVRSVVAKVTASAGVLSLPGEIRPRIESRLGFRVGGKLLQRNVSVGDRVVPGQVLARLDPTDLAPALQAQQALLESARTDRDLAAVELDRLRSLKSQNYISQGSLDRQQATFDSAVSRLNAAQAQLRQARNAIDFQVMRADAAGVVTAVEAEVGQVVTAGQPVIRVAQTAEREVAVNIPEADLDDVRRVKAWSVLLPALDDRVIAAKIRELSPIADPASRTYAARLTLSGNLDDIALGMTALVQSSVQGGPSYIVLPLSALYSRDGKTQVWRIDMSKRTVEPVEVKTAGLLDDSVRIASGISAGDRIVTAGANLLLAGQSVRLLDDPVPQAGGASR